MLIGTAQQPDVQSAFHKHGGTQPISHYSVGLRATTVVLNGVWGPHPTGQFSGKRLFDLCPTAHISRAKHKTKGTEVSKPTNLKLPHKMRGGAALCRQHYIFGI